MTFLFVIGVLFIAGAAGLLTRAFALPRLHMSAQLRQIESYGFGAAAVAGDGPAADWSLRARLNGLAARVGRGAEGRGWRAPVTKIKLRAAGVYTIDPDVFHGYRVIASVTIPLFLLVTTLRSGS